jgi:glutamyl/glutaminyl-tRNA synthetase
LAKRRGDLALSALRERGVDARAVVAWAARVSGQPCADRASAREVLADFDLARVPHEAVRVTRSDLEMLANARVQ